eukprot:213022-Chlamydomonas_euryale.AAC.9
MCMHVLYSLVSLTPILCPPSLPATATAIVIAVRRAATENRRQPSKQQEERQQTHLSGRGATRAPRPLAAAACSKVQACAWGGRVWGVDAVRPPVLPGPDLDRRENDTATTDRAPQARLKRHRRSTFPFPIPSF